MLMYNKTLSVSSFVAFTTLNKLSLFSNSCSLEIIEATRRNEQIPYRAKNFMRGDLPHWNIPKITFPIPGFLPFFCDFFFFQESPVFRGLTSLLNNSMFACNLKTSNDEPKEKQGTAAAT